MKTAATDGHRLAVYNINDALDSDLTLVNEENFSVTLPSRSLREVEKLILNWKSNDPISLFFDKGQVVLLAEDQVLTSRTLEGNYPNYSQLIPKEFSRKIEIDKRIFISSLERIAVLADQHNNVVKLKLDSNNNQMLISADVQDVGSGNESFPINLIGESIEIAFNVKYLLEGLKAISSDKIFLKCNAPTTPAILTSFEEENFIYLIMPIQIRT